MYDLLKLNAELRTRTDRYSKLNLAWLAISLKREVTTVASFRKAFHRHFLTSCDEVEHFSPSAI